MAKAGKHRGTFKYPTTGENAALSVLSDIFISTMTVGLNKWRGGHNEQLAAALMVAHFRDTMGVDAPVITDKMVLYCGGDQPEKRRFDLYFPTLGLAAEVKSYRAGMTPHLRTQMRKDQWLIAENKVKGVWWLLFEGATAGVLRALTQHQLFYLDMQAATPELATNYDGVARFYGG